MKKTYTYTLEEIGQILITDLKEKQTLNPDFVSAFCIITKTEQDHVNRTISLKSISIEIDENS